MAKRQHSADRPDNLGDMPPEVSNAVAIQYPEGLGGHEHYYDPLQPLAGPVENVTPGPKKKTESRSKLGALTEEQVRESRARRARYDTFIEHLVKNSGDEILALSITYGVESELIRADLDKYRTDVMAGMGTSSVSDLLEAAGIGKAARVGILRRHAYDSDPKVSLVALKLAMDLDGDKHDRGTSYETYLRLVLGKQV